MREPQKVAPWLYTAPPWAIPLVSIGVGVAVFAITSGWDLWMRTRPVPRLIFVTPNLLAAFLAGFFHYTTVRALRRRRTMLAHRLQVIADMNHHVRNALELIQLSAATIQQREVVQQIDEATRRITWALTDILGSEPQEPEQRPNRK